MDQAPRTHRRWELTGSGLESLQLRERELPRPGPEELLVRIDACGVCFSDIKILTLGPDHPRLQGRDLERDPVVMGHETAMTVVEPGTAVAGRFPPGSRYLIQADVYSGGRGMAFGYRLPGGYAEYQIIGKEILEGDEGCYLLPVLSGAGHAQAALCEPWACVEAAYAHQPRRGPLPGGRSLVVVVESDEAPEMPDELVHLQHPLLLTAAHHGWLFEPNRVDAEVERLRAEHPGGFDDILVYGIPGPVLAAALPRLLAQGGVLALQGRGSTGRVPVDIGSIHYRGHWYTGWPTGDLYRWDRSMELRPGGIAWFIGAGGPLGQMHLQRALSLPRPPACLIASQRGGPRLEDLRRRYAGLARERGVHLLLLDSRELGEGVYDAVREATGGQGCDDICVIIPDAEVVERAFELLAPGGGMDIFAGVAVGTTAALDLGRVPSQGLRVWGTSGSSIADLRRILERLERGELQTDRVVAAVGGLESVREALEAVRDGIFLGKTVIYPQARGLPLLTLPELAKRHAEIRSALSAGEYWCPSAERALLALYT